MPTIKEFEGQTWVLQTDVDAIVADRVREVSSKKAAAEEAARVAQKAAEEAEAKAKTAEEAAAGAGALKAQLDEAQLRAARAEGRYDRHIALADKGLTDGDVRDAVVWAFERGQEKLPKAQQQDLATVLEGWLKDPEQAPASVRPHLAAVAQAGDDTGGEQGGSTEGTGGQGGDAEAGGSPQGQGQPRGRGALPQLPGQRSDKPVPNQPTLTVDQIYAADGDELDKLMEQFKAGRS